jgi:hypothetical protein
VSQSSSPDGTTDAYRANSTLAIAAGVVLLVMGLLLTLAGIALVALVIAGSGPFGEVEKPANAGQALSAGIAVATIVLGPAALHIAAAIGVFSRRGWGRMLGLAIGWLGLAVGSMVLIARSTAQPLLPALIPALIVVVAYGFTFVALMVSAGRFAPRRRWR